MLKIFTKSDQNANNTLRMITSELGDATALINPSYYMNCQYSTTVTNFPTNTVTGFNYTKEGVAGVVTFASAQTTVSGVKSAILDSLQGIGVLLDDDPRDISVSLNGTDLQIEIYGELVIDSFIDNSAATYAATAKCNTKSVADYTSSFGALTAATLIVDGVTSGTTYTATNDAGGATALQTALQGDALLTGYQSLTVSYNATLNGLVVTIVTDLGKNITLSGKQFTQENPQQIFVV